MKTYFKEPKKDEEVKYYFNSTIRIKKDAKPINRYKTSIRPAKEKKNIVVKTVNKIERGTELKRTNKKKYQKAYKPKYPYRSIFTEDLKTCYISGRKDNVEIHHIFSGPRKHFSEKYGFILPLTSDWHTLAPYSIHHDRKLELEYKIKCQEYWLQTLNKTREEWISECGKWWE